MYFSRIDPPPNVLFTPRYFKNLLSPLPFVSLSPFYSNFPRLDHRFSDPLSSKNSYIYSSSFSFPNQLIIHCKTWLPLFTLFVRFRTIEMHASPPTAKSVPLRGERGGIDYERLAWCSGTAERLQCGNYREDRFIALLLPRFSAAGLQRTTRLLSFSAPPPFGGWMDGWIERHGTIGHWTV